MSLPDHGILEQHYVVVIILKINIRIKTKTFMYIFRLFCPFYVILFEAIWGKGAINLAN
jgi:hypothetical protein